MNNETKDNFLVFVYTLILGETSVPDLSLKDGHSLGELLFQNLNSMANNEDDTDFEWYDSDIGDIQDYTAFERRAFQAKRARLNREKALNDGMTSLLESRGIVNREAAAEDEARRQKREEEAKRTTTDEKAWRRVELPSEWDVFIKINAPFAREEAKTARVDTEAIPSEWDVFNKINAPFAREEAKTARVDTEAIPSEWDVFNKIRAPFP